MTLRALPVALALALAATQLGGCVAVALVPIAASGAVAKRSVDIGKERKGERKGQKQVKPIVTVGKGTAALPPLAAADPIAAQPAPQPEELLPAPVAPVSPGVSSDDDPFGAVTAFVMDAVENARSGKARTSALLDQRSLTSLPRMQPCADQRGALVIDLDPGDKPFDLADPPSPAPDLAEHLRRIRGTGTAVVWIAMLPESAGEALGTSLKATGLDPLGIDKTLLLRRGETRKQELLLRASEDWCVLAIAGDRKGDFDEVFDYLRNPDGPVALALEQHVGAGWFLVPPPIR